MGPYWFSVTKSSRLGAHTDPRHLSTESMWSLSPKSFILYIYIYIDTHGL